jgi:hypothetical protein
MQDKVFSWNLALHQTGSLWTRTCGAKPSPALPNCHVRSPVFWDVMHRWVVIPYKCFGTTCRSHLQRSRNPKQQSMIGVNWRSLLFSDFVHCLRSKMFQKAAVFPFIGIEATNLVNPLYWAILSSGYLHQSGCCSFCANKCNIAPIHLLLTVWTNNFKKISNEYYTYPQSW